MSAFKIKTSPITNPFILYSLSMGGALLVYALKWSSQYDFWNSSYIFFLIATIFVSIIFSKFAIIRKCNVFRPVPIARNNKRWLIFIIIGYTLEFIYCRQIPLFSIALGGIGNYKDFTGIPTFHPLLAMLTNFWGIYWFLQYQSHLKTKYLRRYAFLMFIPFLLTLNRGGLIVLTLSYIFLYLMRIGSINTRIITRAFIIFIAFIMLFGWIGNSRDQRSRTEGDFILNLGGANSNFFSTGLPNSFFWFYLYAATPSGNIQNVMEKKDSSSSIEGLMDAGVENGMPDFISKRLNFLMTHQYVDSDHYLVNISLNASTIYYLPYLRAGIPGMIAMFLFISLLTLFYAAYMPRTSPYFLIGWVANLACFALGSFANLWTNGSLQIILLPIVIDCFGKCLKKLTPVLTCNSSAS